MSDVEAVLRETADLPSRERAAVITHYIYVETARRVGWDLRVPADWRDLSDDAKAFNVATVDTWASEGVAFGAFTEIILEMHD